MGLAGNRGGEARQRDGMDSVEVHTSAPRRRRGGEREAKGAAAEPWINVARFQSPCTLLAVEKPGTDKTLLGADSLCTVRY
jgi:hypothetical protein